MKILHLASANRWTGAAAVAFAEVESLRRVGVEAHYAYVGGYKLEEKLGRVDYAHPILEREQNPRAFARTLGRLREVIRRHEIDVLHSHLSYDHVLAMALRRRDVKVVRTFHSRRTLRRDPFNRMLQRMTDRLAVVNASFVGSGSADQRWLFTPPPLDTEQFSPSEKTVRRLYGLSENDYVVGMIGKVSPNRGFEEAIRTFDVVASTTPEAKMLIIGHGPHRPFLEEMIASRELQNRVIWAGYHEEDLAEHFRAMDVMLFTVPGSDEGHRAVSEAMGCGVPVVSFPIAGVEAVLGALADRTLATEATPEAAAEQVRQLRLGASAVLRDAARQQAMRFSFAESGQRLKSLYEELLSAGPN